MRIKLPLIILALACLCVGGFFAYKTYLKSPPAKLPPNTTSCQSDLDCSWYQLKKPEEMSATIYCQNQNYPQVCPDCTPTNFNNQGDFCQCIKNTCTSVTVNIKRSK